MKEDAMSSVSGNHDGAHRMKKIAITVMDASSLIAFFLVPADLLLIAALIRQNSELSFSSGIGSILISIMVYDIIPGSIGAYWMIYRYVMIARAKHPSMSETMLRLIPAIALITIIFLTAVLYDLIGRG